MKKLTLIIFFAIGFIGCKKEIALMPNSTDTWITGKWYLTKAYNDTTANPTKVNENIYHDILTFSNDNTVSSLGAKATFQYSLSTMSVNESGAIYKIKQTSTTTMSLTYYGTFSSYQLFTKQ
jgi:hypothetical protein